MERKNWTEEEVTLALAVYFQTPYGRISAKNPMLKSLAEKIGRSAGAVSYKLANLADLDKRVVEAGRKGFSNGSKIDALVWEKYVNEKGDIALQALTDKVVAICSERVISPVGIVETFTPKDIITERVVSRIERCRQSMFRNVVLSRYHNRCAVTGLQLNELLEAAHIVSWAEDPTLRLEPSNGIALNPFIHSAYDNNFLGIDPDGIVHVSDRLMEHSGDDCMTTFLQSIQNKAIHFPYIGKPSSELLDRHYQCYLRAN